MAKTYKASVLSVFDENGNKIPIPAIIGASDGQIETAVEKFITNNPDVFEDYAKTSELSAKMDKVAGGTKNNFIVLDENGNAVDSGKSLNNAFVPMEVLTGSLGPHISNLNIHVTADEKAAWTAKSDFSGDYNDLTSKPSIPAKTSDLTNDSNYITNAVSDLTNYYLKSETYTQDEVNELVAAIPKFAIEVVTTLPTENISATTVYLVKSGEETDNLYTEYINVNGSWEYLGKQTVDLTNYALKSDIPTNVSKFTNDAGYVTDISGKMDKVTGGTSGNIITLDANGNAVDSGKSINNSFIPMTILNQAIGPHLGDSTVHVTADDKAAWNAKSNFSGSYNDLTDKPTSVTLVDEVTSAVYTLKVSNGQLILREVTE